MQIDRSVYQRLINKIEIEYPVNEWIHNGYHIWPLLRIRLFFKLVHENENSRHQGYNRNRFQRHLTKIKSIPELWGSYLNLNDNIRTIYCGAPSHRVNYQGKKFNRYFDPLMDKEMSDNLLLEYSSSSKEGYYKPNRVLLVSDMIMFNKPYLKFGSFLGIENRYAKKLNVILDGLGIKVENFVSHTSGFISKVDQSRHFFYKLLQKISPKKIYMLCYYNNHMLGMNIAADQLNIPTIDMQHGPQGNYHLAYGMWQDIPKEGYESLPNIFYTWDKPSANALNKWAKNTIKHSAVVTGNPWVEGWKRGDFISHNHKWPDNLILYTLQPTGDPLEPYLLETIKSTYAKWNWWLRIHPRQKGETASIKKRLRDYGLLEHVNIKDATELLLPQILINTKVHLTKFSGCAVEAFDFNTPSIILDKRGEDIFEDYFSYNIVDSCTEKNAKLLVVKINSFLN
jgi:hypothetical protein